jgi:preprotein translocase subunit SecE
MHRRKNRRSAEAKASAAGLFLGNRRRTSENVLAGGVLPPVTAEPVRFRTVGSGLKGRRWKMEKNEEKKEKVSKKAPEKKADDGVERANPIKKLVEFLSDVKRELKKVAWPTRSETLASTWVVIALTFIFSIFFFLCDSALMLLMKIAFV